MSMLNVSGSLISITDMNNHKRNKFTGQLINNPVNTTIAVSLCLCLTFLFIIYKVIGGRCFWSRSLLTVSISLVQVLLSQTLFPPIERVEFLVFQFHGCYPNSLHRVLLSQALPGFYQGRQIATIRFLVFHAFPTSLLRISDTSLLPFVITSIPYITS